MGFRVPFNRNSPAYYKGNNTGLLTAGGLEFRDGVTLHPYAGDPTGVLILPIGSLVMDSTNSKVYQATDSVGGYREVGEVPSPLTIGRGLAGVGSVGDPLRMSGSYYPAADSATAFQLLKANTTTALLTVDSVSDKLLASTTYVPTQPNSLATMDYVDDEIIGASVYNNHATGNIFYVSPTGLDTNNGLTVPSAFLTIQFAIDTAVEGDTILVYPGTYEVAAEISLNKGLNIIGVGGAEVTIIQPTTGSQIRCLYIYETKLARVIGFTFRNGATILGGAGVNPGNGGGVCIWQAVGVTPSVIGSLIRDCIIENCTASQYGGGVYLMDHKSAAVNCIVRNCSTPLGGVRGGGGIGLRWEGYAYNCLVYNCTSQYGGGIMSHSGICRIDNCTVVDNLGGGGIILHNSGTGHEVYNTICYYNAGGNISALSSSIDVRHTCSTPVMAGTNNVATAPEFVNRASDNYELLPSSVLLSHGMRLSWHEMFSDLNGNKIKYNISLGCYNYDSGIMKELNIYGYLESRLKTYFDTIYGGDGMAFANVEVSGTQNVAALTEVELATYTVPAGFKAQWLAGTGSSDGLTRFRVTADTVDRIVPTWNTLMELTVNLQAPLEFAAGTVLRVFAYNDTLEGNTNSVSATLYLKTVSV